MPLEIPMEILYSKLHIDMCMRFLMIKKFGLHPV